MLTGSFDGITLNNIVGYRISVAFTPGGGNGFAGNIYVTLLDRTEAATPFEAGVDLGPAGKERHGKLVFSGDNRTYSFANIDLNSIEAGVTRNQRFRYLQFKYNSEYGSVTKPLDISMDNSSPERLEDNKLQKDYDGEFPSTAEHLLGFRTLAQQQQVNVHRFYSLRGGDNNIIGKLIEMNDAVRKGGALPSLTIGFSKGKLEIDQKTISKIYVHESYGSFHAVPLPKLSEIIAVQKDKKLSISSVLKPELDEFSSHELLDHNDNAEVEQYRDWTTQAITLVFQQGKYQQFIIT